jgi:Zinc carboxypeptidase
MRKSFFLLYLILCTMALQAEDLDFYFGGEVRFDPRVPRPQDVLGYQVGDWHVRHDQLVRYMEKLAETSSRVKIETIGHSWEQRPLLHLVISTPENLARLEEIRKEHLEGIAGKRPVEERPVVIWIGYSIHGNEPSGANAALLFAYYLAAAEQVADQLKEAVIILEPCLNPDGLARFSSWVNAHRGRNLVADENHLEHHEVWPRGRGNHYLFDLNRDWLLQVNPESQARIARFHHWRPNILTDHHEMDTGSTFFFQPGVPSRQNPMTPSTNLELTQLIAGYHAKALDAQGQLYFTEQSFDDYYYGKGSTYPDIHGCIGILFEQASSRGHLQTNTYGQLRFQDTIKNQVTTSLSTLQAGIENRQRLLRWQQEDAAQTLAQAKDDAVEAFLFYDQEDPMRVWAMTELLLRHQIEVYRLAQPRQQGEERIATGYLVPLRQPQYRLIKSLFETTREFADTTFYDVSTWHLPSAFGVNWTPFKLSSGTLGERVTQSHAPTTPAPEQLDAYAYAFSWQGFNAPRAAYRLMRQGVKLRYATLPFTIADKAGTQTNFTQGSVILPMGIQSLPREQVLAALRQVAERDGILVQPVASGLTPRGIDLGSANFVAMNLPKVALLGGEGTDAGEVGSLWHLLDVQADMPVAMLDLDHVNRQTLTPFTHLVLADGGYGGLLSKAILDLQDWVKRGGILLVTGSAVAWAIEQKIVEAQWRAPEKKEDAPKRLPFEERANRRAAENVSGAAFLAVMDPTHPLCYGFPRKHLPMFRTDHRALELLDDVYANPLVYTDAPLISGYVSKDNLERIKGSAAAAVSVQDRGAVILLTDPPCFRGFWVGTRRLLLNGLFFDVKP